MDFLLKVAQQIVISRLLGSGFPLSSKSKIGLGLIILSVLLLLISIGFLIYGGYLWFNVNYPPELAMLFMGLLLLTISVLAGAGAYGVLHYQSLRARRIQEEMQATVCALFETVQEELTEPVQENPKTAVLLASLAGYATGNRIL